MKACTLDEVGHSEILSFADGLKQEGRSIGQINRVLLALRYYFSYLYKEGLTAHNPAAGITLKGAVRNIPHNLLEKAELEELYEKYEIRDERTHRNKVILGLLVYQALTKSELEVLLP